MNKIYRFEAQSLVRGDIEATNEEEARRIFIEDLEQGCGRTKERILRDGKGYDLTCIPQQLCESCSAQLSLLKTLQKEVEEVLDNWVIDYNERTIDSEEIIDDDSIARLKKELEGIGVEK